MRGRLAVAANLLKVWLLFALPALAMGFAGWRLGGWIVFRFPIYHAFPMTAASHSSANGP